MFKFLKKLSNSSRFSNENGFSATKVEISKEEMKQQKKNKLMKLKTLVKLQLSEKLKWKDNASTSYKVATVAKRVGYTVLAYVCFLGILFLIFNIVHVQPHINIFIFLIAILQLLSLITCIADGSKLLYTSKDNSLLLTYPVKHKMIFESKILVMYIIELLKSLALTFPLMMAYATVVKGVISVNFVLSAIVYSVLLPLIPVLLGALISIPFVYLTNLLKRIQWVKIVFSVGIIVGLGFLTNAIVKGINAVSPIRLTSVWNSFNDGIQTFTGKFNKFALYVNLLGKGMIPESAKQAALCHLSMIGIVIVLIVLAVLFAMPTFFRLASSSAENATSKKHAGKNKAHSSTFITFMRKEFTMSVRNIANFISDYVFLFALPFVLVILGTIVINIDRNELGMSTAYGIIGLIVLMLVSASNTACATSISSEGSEFALIKTAPGKTSNIIWSKLVINWVVSFVMTTISFGVLLIFTRSAIKAGTLDLVKVIVVYLFVSFVNLGLLFWSIQLDIVNPKLREFANSQNKNEIANASQSIVIGLIFSVIFSAILIVLFTLIKNDGIVIPILLTISVIFAALRFFFLIKYRDAYFEEIQL